MTKQIPSSYMELATIEGLPDAEALDYYDRKISKKGSDDLVFKLVAMKKFKDEASARRSLSRLWKNYQRYNAVGTVELDSGKQLPARTNAYVNEVFARTETTYLERAVDGLEKMIGPLGSGGKAKAKNPGGREIIAGDFHIPFADQTAFRRLMDDPAKKLRLMGDFLDMIAATRHRQTYDNATVRSELAEGRAALEILSKKFDEITIIQGNHDQRPRRRMQDVMPGMLPLFVDPIYVLAAGLENVTIVSTEITNTAPSWVGGENSKLEFMGVVNDSIFGHFDGFCGADAPRQVETWLAEWDHILKLENPPRAIFQAHTHRLGLEFTPKGRLLVATGCMCRPMDYQFINHGKYKPPVPGFVTLERDKLGLVDLDSPQLIYCREG